LLGAVEVLSKASGAHIDTGLIAFDARSGIFVVRSDGTGLRKVVSYRQPYPAQPAWSPNGEKLAYDKTPTASTSHIDIYTSNADGSREQRLTSGGKTQHRRGRRRET
jgi:Tol biopolymer transport system component